MGLQKIRAPAISQHEGLTARFGCKGVYILDESVNPASRTFKDLRNQDLLERTRELNEVVFVQITQGNSGYSMGKLAQQEKALNPDRKIHIVNIVPKGLSQRIKRELESCSIVHEVDLSRRVISRTELIEIARRLTGYSGDNVLTVENVEKNQGDASTMAPNGYGTLVDDISSAPIIRGSVTHIVCPVGGGELAIMLARYAESKWGSSAPKIVGFTDPKNPLLGNNGNLVTNLGDGIADKLRSGYAIFFDAVKDLIKRGKMELFPVSSREIIGAYEQLNREGILCEPSAAAAFAGAIGYKFKPDDVVVIVNTGRGLFDERIVDRFWIKRVKRFMRNAGIALAGGALAISLIAGGIMFSNYEHANWRTRLELQVMLYFDKDKSAFLSEDEATEACMTIPKNRCLSESGIHQFYYDTGKFSDRELAFIVAYQQMAHQLDSWRFSIMGDMRKDWVSGKFDELTMTHAPRILNVDRWIRRALTPAPKCNSDEAIVLNPRMPYAHLPEECVPAACPPKDATFLGPAGDVCKPIRNPHLSSSN